MRVLWTCQPQLRVSLGRRCLLKCWPWAGRTRRTRLQVDCRTSGMLPLIKWFRTGMPILVCQFHPAIQRGECTRNNHYAVFSFKDLRHRSWSGDQNKIWTPEVVLQFIPEYKSYPVGSYHYSDTGYVILGMAVLHLYGRATLNEAIQQDLLVLVTGDVLSDTFMRYDPVAQVDRAPPSSDRYKRLAHRNFNDVVGRYNTNMTDIINFPTSNSIISSYYNSADWASGGLVSTVDDLASFW